MGFCGSGREIALNSKYKEKWEFLAKGQWGGGGITKRKYQRSGEILAKLAELDSCRKQAGVMGHHSGVSGG